MQIQYSKLVRDHIPEIISAAGKTCLRRAGHRNNV